MSSWSYSCVKYNGTGVVISIMRTMNKKLTMEGFCHLGTYLLTRQLTNQKKTSAEKENGLKIKLWDRQLQRVLNVCIQLKILPTMLTKAIIISWGDEIKDDDLKKGAQEQ